MQTYNKSYIIEILGKSFSEDLMRKQVGSENNLLYIPFIDNLPALESRVAQRNQFGSPNVDEILMFYQNSYGTSLLKALDSGIFSQIIIQGNNTHNYVMLSLERITPKGYILVKEAANNIQEALYIRAVLQALLIPDMFHGARALLYKDGTWSFHYVEERP